MISIQFLRQMFFKSSLVSRLMIFFIAISTRSLLGYVFFGSVDIPCFISMTHCTLHHDLLAFPMWNYVPVLTYFLWITGFLAIKTSLPLAFCIKLVPIFFDSLLAVLIVDIIQKRVSSSAYWAGLTYALCPIPILITSIHGQWDALFLFFLILSFYIRDYFQDTYIKFFWFGLLFGFSLLLKPVSLIFLPFFFTPAQLKWGEICTALFRWRTASLHVRSYLKFQLASCLGFAIICIFVVSILVWYGFNLFKLADTIGRYGNRGVQVLGLPFFWLIKDSVLASILKHRLLFLGAIAVLAWVYHCWRITAFQAILITFALLFGLSGICPQYFMWLVPFLLIAQMYFFTILYSAIVTSFLVLFYANPWANPVVPYQNMLSFAALKSWLWCTPPAVFASEQFVPVIHMLGNCIIPILCILIVLVVCLSKKSEKPANRIIYRPWLDVYLASTLTLFGFVFVLRRVFDFDQALQIFVQKNQCILDSYAVTIMSGKPSALFECNGFLNVITLCIFVLIFCITSLIIASWRVKKEAQGSNKKP